MKTLKANKKAPRRSKLRRSFKELEELVMSEKPVMFAEPIISLKPRLRFVNTSGDRVTSERVGEVYKEQQALIYEYISSLSSGELLDAADKLSGGIWDTNILGEYPEIPGICSALFWAIVRRIGAYKVREYNWIKDGKSKEDFFRHAVEHLYNQNFEDTHLVPIDCDAEWI